MSKQSPFSDGVDNTMPPRLTRSSNKRTLRNSTISARRPSSTKKQATHKKATTISRFGDDSGTGSDFDSEGGNRGDTR